MCVIYFAFVNHCYSQIKDDRVWLFFRPNRPALLQDTWLETIPESALQLPGFELYRAERDPELSGQNKGYLFLHKQWLE